MKLSTPFSKAEKIALLLFTALFFVSSTGIIRAFYVENTELRPAEGGEMTSGVIGTIAPDYHFNPLFSDGIESDVTDLVFSGLMRFDPETGQIKDHLATHTLSPDKKVYDFTLKENVIWHDGQPLTANDILFTFRDVIQHPDFPVQLLKNAFSDVIIEGIDDRTVRFTIPEKRKTFFTNFTTGLLPRHLLTDTPVAEMLSSSFNQEPIGCGPYRFEGVLREADFTQVRLTAFPDYLTGHPKIELIKLNVFPNNEKLVAHISELDSIRPMQTREVKIIPTDPRFNEIQVVSPRYLAVFFNMKNDTLTTKKIRQAMRAAIDTTAMAEKYQGERVDTPLVELWPQTDVVNTSVERAHELMKESGYYYLSERQPMPSAETPVDQETPIEEAAQASNEEPTHSAAAEVPADPKQIPARFVSEPGNTLWQATGQNDFFLVGSFPAGTVSVRVNGYRLQLFNTDSGRFSYHAAVSLRTLRQGENTYEVRFYGGNSELIDSETVTVFLEPDPAKLSELQSQIGIPNGPVMPPQETMPAEPTVAEAPKEETPPETTEPSAPDTAENETVEPETVIEPVPEEQNDETASDAEGMPQEEADQPIEETPEATQDQTKDTEPVTAISAERPYREDNGGYHVKLTLTYLSSFEYLEEIAQDLVDAWFAIGVEVSLLPVNADEFREKIRTRDYEIILLPQDIGYNLDAYPYFHLSQAVEGGLNIANWKNLEASVLLEQVRATHDENERLNSLARLRDIIVDDVPAIFLFTPKYSWLLDRKIRNVHVSHLAVLSDRFARIDEMYTREKRQFKDDAKATDFFSWFLRQSNQFFSFS